ncbi:MAG: hypothetical protein Q9188_003241 [Gyalolechia gomerana]
MQSALAPGAGLDGMNRVRTQNIAAALEILGPEKRRTMTIGPGEWCRHEITLAKVESVHAREFVSKPFQEYLEAKYHETGSIFIQNRYNTSVKNKIPVGDIARYEIGGSYTSMSSSNAEVNSAQFSRSRKTAELLKGRLISQALNRTFPL